MIKTRDTLYIELVQFYAWEVNYGRNLLAMEIDGEITSATK